MSPLDDALRTAIRAELNTLFDEKIRPLLEARSTNTTPVRNDAPLYVSPAQAAKMVAVTAGTIQAWVRTKQLRGYKAGRLLRIKVEDLHEFMKSATVGEVIDLDAAASRIMSGGTRRPRSR
jgi:excisionase family DNA binding protein